MKKQTVNREILFRGKRPNSGKWIEGFLYQEGGFSWILSERFKSPECSCEVLTETIDQFIGLTDRNGKKIFERDIVKKRYYPLGSDEKAIEYYEVGVVVYSYSKFGVIMKIKGTTILDENRKLSHQSTERKLHSYPDWVDNNFSYDRSEVIGNIHDNPELLK